MKTNANLTQEELLHLAIESVRRGDHGSAISYLKDGVVRFSEDAKLAYLLGAEYAQIALYDKAEQEMERALQLDPELVTTSFQLGLLQLSQGKLDAAKTTWQRLDKLPTEHALQLFKSGLLQLAEDQYAQARSLLQQGISANTFSPELNLDMENVLASMPTGDGADNIRPLAPAEHVWLSAYRSENTDRTN